MLEPLLCFLAILVFVIALLVGCALSFVWPAIALVLAVAAFATWHPFLGVKILQQALKSLGGAFVVLGETAAALWHPLRPIRTVLPLPPPLPNLSRLAADVAEQMGQPPFDGVLISPEANFGVFEAPRKGAGPARYLVAGTPLLFVFTVDELRAVIAHEVAHLALRHTRWTRVLGRWTDLLDAFAEHNAGSFSPLAWSIVFSAWLMRGARGPWVRRDELEADFMASQVVGRDSLLSALRKAHEQAAGLEVMMTVVATRSREVHVAPRSWTEAAYRAFEGLEAGDRRALRNAFREDPFDVDGRTHPPFAQRSSALIGLPRSGPGDTRRVLALLPDVLREEAALTARELRCARVVSSREWADAVHPKAVARDRYEGVAAATAFQEIEFLD